MKVVAPDDEACCDAGPPEYSGPGSPLLNSCTTTLWLFKAFLFDLVAKWLKGSSELSLLANEADYCRVLESEVACKWD